MEQDFGERFRALRQARDLTQAELAARIGCSTDTVRAYEADRRRPSKQVVQLLIRELGVPPGEREEFTRLARAPRPRGHKEPQSPTPGGAPVGGRPVPRAPAPLTPLIGRHAEVRSLIASLRDPAVRLLTVVGPPGVGKTRLALHVATQVADDFPDGVVVTSLVRIRDPALVLPTIARELGVEPRGARAILDRLAEQLGERRILLVVDNFEHVGAAAPDLVVLLRAAPGLTVLVTSREVLRQYGEHRFVVPPLAVPDPRRRLSPEDLARVPAIELFVRRARAVAPNFALTPDTAAAIAEVCARLDGLPLAVELAAARAAVLSPLEMLTQLRHRLDFLGSGPREQPDQPRSLRGAIDWSYALLPDVEKRLFRLLSVFVGGADIGGVRAVLGNAEATPSSTNEAAGGNAPIAPFDIAEVGDIGPVAPALLDALAALIERSLVSREEQADGRPRFGMLETIREYAAEQLAASGEMDGAHRRHAAHFLAIAEAAAPELTGPRQAAWLDRLERETGNLGAALRWGLDRGEAELALRLAAALWPFWLARGYLDEGRRWLAQALARANDPPTPARAKAEDGAGALAFGQGDFPAADRHYRAALAMHEALGNVAGVTGCFTSLGSLAQARGAYAEAVSWYEDALSVQRAGDDATGMARTLGLLGDLRQYQGEYARANECYTEALARQRELGNRRGVADGINDLAWVEILRGEYAPARARLAESLAIGRELGYRRGVAFALTLRGWAAAADGDHAAATRDVSEALGQARELGDRAMVGLDLALLGLATMVRGDLPRALALLEESLDVRRAINYRPGIAHALCLLGWIALVAADAPRAAGSFRESLKLYRELGDRGFAVMCLEGFAGLAARQGQALRAARLAGAAESQREELGATMLPVYQTYYRPALEAARQQADETDFQTAWCQGRSLTLDQAITAALD